ncbi:MAG: LacI family DNA-binding transcriptional regulator [Dehalococcoidia bacterium]
MPTIHDVAKRAGVSTSTVSRALAGEPRVSEETRLKVSKMAETLGYRPSRSAQSLRGRKTWTIGMLAPDLENPINQDHLRATISAAHEAGYTVLVADAQDSPSIQDRELRKLRDFRVDGLIIGRGILHVTRGFVDFVASGVPVDPDLGSVDDLEELVGSAITPFPERGDLDSGAAMIAYRRFFDLGHRRFAVFRRGQMATELAHRRVNALNSLLEERGEQNSWVTVISIDEFSDCIPELQAVMARPDRPTAVISANGRLTPFVLQGLQSAGLQIPRDVSVLCFGDSAWHLAYSPPLSVIRHDYALAAKRSVELLVSQMERREMKITPLRPSEFVSRASIGPAPAL